MFHSNFVLTYLSLLCVLRFLNSIVYRVSLHRPPHALNMEMFSTPPKLFYLPSYVGRLVQVFAGAPPPIPIYSQYYNSRILVYVDVEMRQGKDSNGSSSHSVSMALEDKLELL